jgi:hypothetical protein
MHGWPIDSNTNVVWKITAGKYLFVNREESSRYATTPLKFDATQNFEIECLAHMVLGSGVQGYGLVWGFRDHTGECYKFTITTDGYAEVIRSFYYGNIKHLTSKVRVPNIKREASNKLKITKKEDRYTFFVNDSAIGTTRYKELYSDNIGFFVEGPQGVAFDNLIVRNDRTKKDLQYLPPQYEVFREDFNDNRNLWYLDSLTTIKNGSYHMVRKAPDGMSYFVPVSVDIATNFKIESSIRQIANESNNYYGLCLDDTTNELTFLITNSGYFVIDEYDGSEHRLIKKMTASSSINRGSHAENKLTIQKRNGMVMYLINDVLVCQDKNLSTNIEGIGFTIYQGIDIAIDYLVVTSERQNDLSPAILSSDLCFQEEFNNPIQFYEESYGEEEFDLGLDDYYGDEDEGGTETDRRLWEIVGETVISPITHATKVERGKLLLENKQGQPLFISRGVQIDQNKDFQIEASLTMTESNDRNSIYGITWGDPNNTSVFEVIGVHLGSFYIIRYNNSQEIIKQDWISSGAINRKDQVANTIVILKKSNKFYYYINNKLVHECKFDPMAFKNIGFLSVGKQKLEMDFIRVSYLD